MGNALSCLGSKEDYKKNCKNTNLEPKSPLKQREINVDILDCPINVNESGEGSYNPTLDVSRSIDPSLKRNSSLKRKIDSFNHNLTKLSISESISKASSLVKKNKKQQQQQKQQIISSNLNSTTSIHAKIDELENINDLWFTGKPVTPDWIDESNENASNVIFKRIQVTNGHSDEQICRYVSDFSSNIIDEVLSLPQEKVFLNYNYCPSINKVRNFNARGKSSKYQTSSTTFLTSTDKTTNYSDTRQTSSLVNEPTKVFNKEDNDTPLNNVIFNKSPRKISIDETNLAQQLKELQINIEKHTKSQNKKTHNIYKPQNTCNRTQNLETTTEQKPTENQAYGSQVQDDQIQSGQIQPNNNTNPPNKKQRYRNKKKNKNKKEEIMNESVDTVTTDDKNQNINVQLIGDTTVDKITENIKLDQSKGEGNNKPPNPNKSTDEVKPVQVKGKGRTGRNKKRKGTDQGQQVVNV
jgi:hypothetical protein